MISTSQGQQVIQTANGQQIIVQVKSNLIQIRRYEVREMKCSSSRQWVKGDSKCNYKAAQTCHSSRYIQKIMICRNAEDQAYHKNQIHMIAD